MAAVADMMGAFPGMDIIFIESGGNNLAAAVGADLGVMAGDSKKMRHDRPFLFTNLKTGEGVGHVIAFIIETGGLERA